MTTEAQSEMFAPPVQFVPDHAKPRLTGENYRDAALNAAEANADEAWKAEAERAIRYLASDGQPFTSETVRDLAGDPPGNGSVMGAMIRSAAVRGLIREADGKPPNAKRPGMHGTRLIAWVGIG